MQAQTLKDLKNIATISYLVSGLSVGLWSSNLLARLNLVLVGGVTSSIALSPIRKRFTEKALEQAKRQLEEDHASRRQQLKDWDSELTSKSAELDSQQKDLEQERSKWEQEQMLAANQADREIADRQRQLESEWHQRFSLRGKEIEDEYRALDAERKTLELEQSRLESDRERFELRQQQELELLDKQVQETLHSGLAQLEADKQELEVQARQWVADSLEPLHEEIAALQGENEALTQQLEVATYPKIPRGIDRVCVYLQEVIPALYQLGFKLDYDRHDTNPNRDRVWFRPQNTFDLKDLDKQSGLIQGLLGCKHPLCWRWIEKGLLLLEVSTAGVETAPKTSKKQIADRIVSGEQWLIDLVNNCYHFRISGENGSGKSEFFNNLYCIAKHLVFDGRLDLTLIDPKFPMSPWIIEGEPFIPQYRSWEDASNGIGAMAELVDARIKKAQGDFQPQDWIEGKVMEFTPSMWAIDETDTTMSRYKKEIKDNLRVGLKVGRALKVMVCYMCQSYLPSDLGLNHPDLKASANILLSTSAEEGADDLPMSKERRLEIKEEIAYLNAEGCKYFALVKYPGVSPFVARLPKPKAYAHLRFKSQSAASSFVLTEDTEHPREDNSFARVTPMQGNCFSDSGDLEIHSQKPDTGVVEDASPLSSLVLNGQTSQSEIDRVVGLLKDGVKAQTTIIKSVWGLSRNGRKGSKYQEKVEVVKTIKSLVQV